MKFGSNGERRSWVMEMRTGGAGVAYRFEIVFAHIFISTKSDKESRAILHNI